MAVERPEYEGVNVNVDTLGSSATELWTLTGLTEWSSEQSAVSMGTAAAFYPAAGLTRVYATFADIAVQVIDRVENLSAHYASAVAGATEEYGAADRHSAEAVAAVGEHISGPADPV